MATKAKERLAGWRPERYSVGIEFTEPLLATLAGDPNVAREFILSRAADEEAALEHSVSGDLDGQMRKPRSSTAFRAIWMMSCARPARFFLGRRKSSRSSGITR